MTFKLITRAAARATRGATGACVAIQSLYRDRGAYDMEACARDTACDTASAPCDTTCDTDRHDHDTTPVRATTPPNACCDKALCVRLMHSLDHRCVHCALDPVLTQCIVLSHCLDNCS